MELNKKNIKTIIFILFGAILFYLGIQHINIIGRVVGKAYNLIFPFLLGAMIAFIINVPMSKIENAIFKEKQIKGKRIISLLITIAIVVGIISTAMYIIIPQIAETLQMIAKQLPAAVEAMENWLEEISTKIQILKIPGDIDTHWDSVVATLSDVLQDTAGVMVNNGIGAVSNIIGAIVNFCVATVFAMYILFGKEKLARQVKQIFYGLFKEVNAEKILYVCSLSSKTFSKFISGQCLEACILGFMFFVAMTIFKMPYAMLIAVVIAFSALIPIVGAFLGCILGALLILMVNPMQAFMFVIMFLVLQQIEGNLVYPHVVGSSVGLPSIWVLFAVTIGGKLMGVAGMILFIPLVSVLYSLFRLFIKNRITVKGIPDEKINGKVVVDEDIMNKKTEKESKIIRA